MSFIWMPVCTCSYLHQWLVPADDAYCQKKCKRQAGIGQYSCGKLTDRKA